MAKVYHYYVEGKTEEKIIKVLKTEFQIIMPGKVERLNVVEEKLSLKKLMTLKKGTVIVLVYDVDTNKSDILRSNIELLKKCKFVVLCIPQVNNLEDEILRSCSIRQIKELIGSKSNKEFKNDMIKISNLGAKLIEKEFDFSKFWNTVPNNNFACFKNQANLIKK